MSKRRLYHSRQRHRRGLTASTLVPLLTLGLPTSATAAMLLAAFQQFGLQSGPLLFEREPDLV